MRDAQVFPRFLPYDNRLDPVMLLLLLLRQRRLGILSYYGRCARRRHARDARKHGATASDNDAARVARYR